MISQERSKNLNNPALQPLGASWTVCLPQMDEWQFQDMTKLLILMNFQSRLHAKIGKESWLREKQIHLFFSEILEFGQFIWYQIFQHYCFIGLSIDWRKYWDCYNIGCLISHPWWSRKIFSCRIWHWCPYSWWSRQSTHGTVPPPHTPHKDHPAKAYSLWSWRAKPSHCSALIITHHLLPIVTLPEHSQYQSWPLLPVCECRQLQQWRDRHCRPVWTIMSSWWWWVVIVVAMTKN